MIVDSHCHLDYPNIFDQLDDVVHRAKVNKVKYLLTICTTLESFKKIKFIIKKYNNIYGTFGIHPHETKDFKNIDEKFIYNAVIDNKKIIGVGETGLDYHYNHSSKDIQRKSFIEHIKAAAKLKMPVIVHSRDAEIDTYEILKSEKKNLDFEVLLHCFTGSKDFAKKLIDIGCYISVSGIITFKNSLDLLTTVSYIPIDNLLVETDSPYLAPIPYRGKSNEPSYIIHTINKISEVKNIPKELVASKTSDNFFKIFNIS